MQGCSSSAHTSLSWEETCASKWQQSVLKNTGWACYEDRPGKPGLIANAMGANIEFRMRVTSAPTGGDIVIGFLRSYANMGRVRIGIDGHFIESDRTTNTLDGLWASQTSQQDVAIVSAVALARSHGNRTLSPSNLWNDVEASAELTSMVFDLFGACAEGFSYGGNGCIPL